MRCGRISDENSSALARDSNPAGKAYSTASVAEIDPGYLIGGAGVQLLAGDGVGREGTGRVPAIVLIMREYILLAVFGDEIAGCDLWNARVCHPLFEVLGEWLWKLTHREFAIGQLAGKDGDRGRGLAVGGMEIECAKGDAGLH